MAPTAAPAGETTTGGTTVASEPAPVVFGPHTGGAAPVSGGGTQATTQTGTGDGATGGVVQGTVPNPEGTRPLLLGAGYAPEEALEGSVPPAAPTGLVVQPGSGGGIQLTWQDQSANETGFEVMRQRQSGPNWNRSTTLRVGANATALLDTPGNGVYRYRVRAVNGAGESAFTEWGTMQVAGQPPAAPSQVVASDLGNGVEVRVTWADNSPDETSFEIQRETQSGSSWVDPVTLTAGANATAYTDSAAIGTFRYRVRSVNSAGASLYTAWSQVTIDVVTPAAPTNLQASDQGNQWHVRLTWLDNSANESGFQIERQAGSGSTWGQTITIWVGANVAAFTDSVGVGTFRYRVRAMNSHGSSSFTGWTVASVNGQEPSIPAAPTGVMASDIGNRRAMVSWTDASDNETGFEIERSPAFSTGVVTVAANVVGYIDQCGAGDFSYRVRAVGTSGSSAYSSWANVTVAEIAPAAPSNLQAGAQGTDGVSLTWTDNSNNESGFRIERQTQQSGGTWGSVTTLTAVADATGLSDSPGSGTHRYRIAATNFAGDSPFTAWVTVGLSGGWTTFTPSADTRIVYVSSSEGNDSNDGLSPATPKRTLQAGYYLLRDGYPDWLLLKRGDVWTNEVLGSQYLQWQRSGRSASEPMLVSSYGSSTARPLLKTGHQNAIACEGGGSGVTVSHVAFVGLELYAHTRNPSDPAFNTGSTGSGSYPYGIRYAKGGTNVLVEDCKISYYGLGLLFQPPSETALISDIKIRRCVVTDCYGVGNHSQGIYATSLDRMLVEECVWDHNGWNEQVTGAHATIFNRNLYLSQITNLVCRGNIDANGSSGGMQMRRGGLAERNLYLNNPNSLGMGHPQNDAGTTLTGTIRYNVVLGSRNIADQPRGGGFALGTRVTSMEVYENILSLNQLGSDDVMGIYFNADEDEPTQNVTVRDNIVYRWEFNGNGTALGFRSNPILQNCVIRDNVFFQPDGGYTVDSSNSLSGITFQGNRYYSASGPSSWFRVNGSTYNYSGWASLTGETGGSTSAPSFPDPNRDISSYMASIGGTPSLQGFMAQARLQSRSNWRTQYTSDAVINYIRAGFGKPPIP